MKTSPVVKCSFKNEWQSKNGPMYSWQVAFDNGDSGEFNTKSADKGPWEVGEEASYTLEAKEYNGKMYYKGTKITPFQQGKPGYTSGASKWMPDPEKETRRERWAKQVIISRQSALNTASSLISAGCGPSTVDNLRDIAEQLERWAYRGLDLKSLVAGPLPQPAPEPAPTPAPPAANAQGENEDDGLPF
jgi:hypothetical protein